MDNIYVEPDVERMMEEHSRHDVTGVCSVNPMLVSQTEPTTDGKK